MADEETANLLRSWGLSQDVMEKFRKNDIDCRALKELNEDDVSSFFSTLGQRLRFRSGLKSLHPVVQPVVLGIGPDTPVSRPTLLDIANFLIMFRIVR
ncbi:hypothetical protein JTE90_018736 [Oedothorax gibbosus]|uniref:SAM domain-containing protein n=1 Tax=Oedothorax gibbosus TaxID=931172 RepID=A0AAV6TN03_9ARAC|nr:hypothetical protein JTE90_018736 [Oedothorax gibbosus]